jgi:fructuronate reductase
MTDTPRLQRHDKPPAPGILHLGPGAFFRAFLAPWTDEAMRMAGGDWGIIAVSLQSAMARDQLIPQDCVYTALERGPDGDIARQINAITNVMVAPEDPAAVVMAMADPAVRVVSLTVTEKGYCREPQTGELMCDHPDIAHDLSNPDRPRSAIGFIVAGLKMRRDRNLVPFTILTCDNLPTNGQMTRKVVTAFARKLDPALAEWIDTKVGFPCTMVDRITPATTDRDIEALAERTGYLDGAAVVHEPFRQWVIETGFTNGHPDWAAAGAQFVSNVEAHELMKLRCLNGTHSALAYLGYLAGHETIADTVADTPFELLCNRLWQDEILPSLETPEGEDLPRYCRSLMVRYQNSAIRHRTWQIAMDGSQKLPQRILGTIADRLESGAVPRGLCLVVAAWMRYVGGMDEAGNLIDVRDPLADELKAAMLSDDPVGAVLAIDSIFAPELTAKPEFVEAVRMAYERLCRHGSRASVAAFVA